MADRLEQIGESPEAQLMAYRWPDSHSERKYSLLGHRCRVDARQRINWSVDSLLNDRVI